VWVTALDHNTGKKKVVCLCAFFVTASEVCVKRPKLRTRECEVVCVKLRPKLSLTRECEVCVLKHVSLTRGV
jgi:hypothetical protein